MKMIHLVLLGLVGLQMIGCASTGPRFNPDKLEVRPDMATVYFYRPWGWHGGGLDFPIIANGREVAKLSNGGQFKRFMEPGIYKFHSKQSGLVIDRQLDVILDPGKITYLRGTYHDRFVYTDAFIKEIDQEQAIDEISEL